MENKILQMKIFQKGKIQNSFTISEEAYQKAKEGFIHTPVLLYDDNQTDYSSHKQEQVVGYIKEIIEDRYIDDVYGKVAFFPNVCTDKLNLDFETFVVEVEDYNVNNNIAEDFKLKGIYIS